MERRCDKIIHCPQDSSDEEDCAMVIFAQTYRQEFAPVEVTEEGMIQRADVEISMELLEILKISEVDNLFSCQLRLLLTWRDQRLQLTNLKADPDNNSLSKQELEQLWVPRLVFANTEEREELVRDSKETATIAKLGSVTLATDDNIDNALLSKGSENPITLKRTYKGNNNNAFISCFSLNISVVNVYRIHLMQLLP